MPSFVPTNKIVIARVVGALFTTDETTRPRPLVAVTAAPRDARGVGRRAGGHARGWGRRRAGSSARARARARSARRAPARARAASRDRVSDAEALARHLSADHPHFAPNDAGEYAALGVDRALASWDHADATDPAALAAHVARASGLDGLAAETERARVGGGGGGARDDAADDDDPAAAAAVARPPRPRERVRAAARRA